MRKEANTNPLFIFIVKISGNALGIIRGATGQS